MNKNLKAKFVWDLTEEDWKEYSVRIRKEAEYNPDGAVNTAGVVGCCRTGDLCFDLRAWGQMTEGAALGYELYVGGVDNNYGCSLEGRPYDLVEEYEEFPISVLDMELEEFKKLAEKEFAEFIVDVAPRYKYADLIEKANEELKVW